jgi:hypothetical protein
MKSRMHIPSVTNLFVPESQGQSVGRRLRMVGLIAGLALLVFAAMGLVSIAAADGPVGVANANPEMAELDRVYGTYTSQWNGIVDRELGANLAPLTADRVHGTYTSQWSGIVDRELGASPGHPYGTYTSQWNGMVDRELGRHYGTFAGVWYTDFAAR